MYCKTHKKYFTIMWNNSPNLICNTFTNGIESILKWILPEIFLNVFVWKESLSNIYLYCSRHRGCGTSIENILHHGCVACHLCANTQLIFYCERLIPRCRSSNIHHNDASRYNIVCKIALYWQNDSSPVYIMFKHCTKRPEGWVTPSTTTLMVNAFSKKK